MNQSKLLPVALVFAYLVLVSVAFAAPASNDQPATASANPIRTSLESDLTLKSSLSPEFLPQVATGLRTCRCSCGYPCKTSADCGPGGVCAPGITCCNRSPEDPANRSLHGASLRSRTGAAPEVNIKCK